jgi:stage II sporulation protein D
MNKIFRKLLNISFIAFAVLFMWSLCYAAENIKVLIINEVFPKIPAKDEKIQKLGSVKGDLLVMGTHYSGTIDVWKGDNGLYIINELPLEDYVKDVVAVEIRPDWEAEALKAQSVISRTYALFQKKKNGNSIYHIASSVIDQVYKGNNPDIRVSNAVEATKGEILTFDNSLIEAFYHSTCGGKTENPEDVFGKSYPYLKSVESPCDLSPYAEWERNIEIKDIEEALNIPKIQELSINSYTSTHRVKELNIKTNSVYTIINAIDLRKALGWKNLPSTNFRVSRVGDSIVFKGKGYGHGVGLCQWGALQMAREGKNYKEILAFYYPGTVIQLYEDH